MNRHANPNHLACIDNAERRIIHAFNIQRRSFSKGNRKALKKAQQHLTKLKSQEFNTYVHSIGAQIGTAVENLHRSSDKLVNDLQKLLVLIDSEKKEVLTKVKNDVDERQIDAMKKVNALGNK